MAITELSIRKIIKRLFNLVRLDKAEIKDIYIIAVLAGIIQLSLPLGVQAIISFVQAGEVSSSLVLLILLVVFGVFVSGYMIVLQKKIIEKIQQKIFVRYAYQLTEQLPKLELKSTQSYYLPELINRFFETTTLQKSISKLLLDIPTATLQIFFGLILLSFYHPFFIFFSFVLVVLLVFIILVTFKNAVQTSMNESDYKYKLVAWIQELARVIKLFKYSKNTDLHLQKSDSLTEGYLVSRTEHFNILLIQYWALIGFKVFVTFLMLSIGAYLLINQQLTIGQFIASEIVIITILSSIEKLISSIENVYDTVTSIEKLSKISDKPLEKNGHIIFEKNENMNTVFKTNDMCFSFNDMTPILSNINLEILQNEKVCIMGVDGAGKSILLKILSGIYSVSSGSFNIYNIPVANYNIISLRDKIGLLTNKQDVFEGTLLENITMGHSIPIKNIFEIAQQIGLLDFLTQLPNGLETEIQPIGNQLSTSQIEKILLLRLLVQDYDILLMDEPWIRTETEVKNTLKKYLFNQKNKTIVVVSNDEDFAAKCDKIIFMNKFGKIDFIGKWNDYLKFEK